MRIEGFIICLQRMDRRKRQAEALAAKMPFAMNILDAVDAQNLTDAEIDAAYQRHMHRPRYPFVLRREEVACFLSHRRAWQEILDRGLDAGLVAEDDVDISDGEFRQVCQMALGVATPHDFIRFPAQHGNEKGPTVSQLNSARLIKPRFIGLGMQMQIVGREAARALLAATEQFDRPVDTTIQMPGLVKTRILSARPLCVQHIDHRVGGTTLHRRKKRFGEVIMREIRRSIYRMSVRVLSLSGVS